MNEPAATIPHVADDAAKRRGKHPAIIEDSRSLSYRALAAEMRRAAAGFIHAGLEPGDRVAIWAHNGIDWIVACLGAQAAGGAIVPLNTRFKGGEADYVLARSGARFLVHSRRFLGVDFAALLDGLDTPAPVRRISLPTEEAPSGDWAAFMAKGAANPAAMAEAEHRLAALSPDTVSDIMFTSGTTGAPKGVVTNHRQNVRVYREWVRATTLGEDDRYMVLWPFFHCSGYKSGWLSSLIAGATIYPETTLDVARLTRRVAKEKISVMPGPPTLFKSLLASEEGRDGVATLRLTVTGAAMVAPSLIEDMRDRLGIPMVLTGYGLTETCGTATMTAADDEPGIVVTSPGRALAGTEVACMDEAGNIVPAGSEGEVVVRGYHVMQGYFDDPTATAEAIDAAGWLHTGDQGTIDTAGYLRITGRRKDIYIVGGFNCYPAEIESILMHHPAVADVSIIGIPDERLGEVGKAFVVHDPGGGPLDEAQLIVWCREAMANYKVPRAVMFVAALPRTPTGKVQKFRLAAGEFG